MLTALGPSGPARGGPRRVPSEPAAAAGTTPAPLGSEVRAEPELPELLRLAAPAPAPPPDGCPGRLQDRHTASPRTCPAGPGTASAVGFELVTVFPVHLSVASHRAPSSGPLPPKPSLRGDVATKWQFAVRLGERCVISRRRQG